MAQFPSTSAADGIWTLKKVRRAILGDNWPEVLVPDQFFANTVLLLQADDFADGSQNNTFLDSSTNNHTITRNGNVTQGSFSPFSQDEGKWGVYFDGSDYLSVSDDVSLEVGNSNFTLEAWVYMSSAVNTNGSAIIAKSNTSSIGPYTLIIHPAIGDVSFAISTSGISWTQEIKSGSTLSTHTWHHIAGVRNGDVFTLYVDGVAENSYTISAGASLVNNAENLQIGWINYPSTQFNGYISNARLVKGTAVYTSAFTPSTTPLTAISGTSLLTCQSNRFVDNSSNAHSITVNGDPEVTPFSPFAPSTAYNPATKGGSFYIDTGFGDGLVVATDTTLNITGDFTIECWYYNVNAVTYATLFGTSNGSAGSETKIMFDLGSAGEINFQYAGGSLAASNAKNQEWNHVAVTRSGSTTRLFLNGNLEASTTSSYTFTTGQPWVIGNRPPNAGSGNYVFGGYISDARCIKGTALYTSAFTPPNAPLTAITNTSLLCNFTNAGIYDGTGRNVLETVGDAQVDTAVKKYGTGSMQFDGTGDYLQIPSNNLFDVSGGAFTIEGWVNFNTNGNQGIFHLYSSYFPGGVLGYSLQQNASNNFAMYASGAVNSSTKSVTTGVWYHFAVVRNSSGTLKLFIDGTEELSFSDSTTGTQTHLVIGGYFSTSYLMNGYIDDLRITKGVARYTANFTPPAAKLEQQ